MVKEIKGYQVLHTLLERAITAVENKCEQKNTHIDNLLLRMIPARYTDTNKPLYERLLNICTYISLLTDGKALERYEMMKNQFVLIFICVRVNDLFYPQIDVFAVYIELIRSRQHSSVLCHAIGL